MALFMPGGGIGTAMPMRPPAAVTPMQAPQPMQPPQAPRAPVQMNPYILSLINERMRQAMGQNRGLINNAQAQAGRTVMEKNMLFRAKEGGRAALSQDMRGTRQQSTEHNKQNDEEALHLIQLAKGHPHLTRMLALGGGIDQKANINPQRMPRIEPARRMGQI